MLSSEIETVLRLCCHYRRYYTFHCFYYAAQCSPLRKLESKANIILRYRFICDVENYSRSSLIRITYENVKLFLLF